MWVFEAPWQYAFPQTRAGEDGTPVGAALELQKHVPVSQLATGHERRTACQTLELKRKLHCDILNGMAKPRQWRDVLDGLEKQEVEGDVNLYSSLLGSCSKVRALPEGKRVHSHVIRRGMENCCSAQIVNMYIQCGSLEDAYRMLNKMCIKDLALWNALVSAYMQQGHYKEAVQIFGEICKDDLPDESLFMTVIGQCTTPAMLEYGQRIHSWAVSCNMDSNVNIGTALLKMYMKCGNLEQARMTFHGMQQRNAVCWTVMMSMHVQQCSLGEALQLFNQMLLEGVMPNEVTFITILNACANSAALAKGKKIHSLLLETGFQSLTPVAMSVMKMYGKCGSLEDARNVLDTMEYRDVAAWTLMITSYSHYGELEKAFQLLKEMDCEGDAPNEITFLAILRAFKNPEARSTGELIHACILENGFESDLAVGTGLVNMYAKFGAPLEAHQAFAKMLTHGVSSWNCLLAAYAQNGQWHQALLLFQKMQLEGFKPDGVTINTVLDACTRLKALQAGMHIHKTISDSVFKIDFMVETALITFYGKCGELQSALRIFEALKYRDNVTWNAMIVLHNEHGDCKGAMRLYYRMQQEGMAPGRITFLTILSLCSSPAEGKLIHSCIIESRLELDLEISNALISMYGKCGTAEDALWVFERIPRRDVVSWTALIGVYAQHGHPKSLELFERMQMEKMVPNSITFIAVINACASLLALKEGKRIHASIPEKVLAADEFLQTALVNMYAKCGCLDKARSMFNRLTKRDLVLWTSMVAAYAQHGHIYETLKLFRQMQQDGVKPDSITFVSVLSACSHAGCLNEGLQHFDSISRDHGISPSTEHYGCMIDLLGRSGQLKEAEYLIERSPYRLNLVLWMTLLGACRVRSDLQRGKRAAERVLELDPENTAAQVVLSNMYAELKAYSWDGI